MMRQKDILMAFDSNHNAGTLLIYTWVCIYLCQPPYT